MNYNGMTKKELIEELNKLKAGNMSNIHLINEWEQTFNALPDLITIMDVNHRIKRVNKAMAVRLNVDPDIMVGAKCFELIHGTDEPPDFCPHKKLLEDMLPHTNEFPIESLQGDFIVSVSPILNDNGELTGSVHVAHDITERKKLDELTRLLAAIVESSDDAIIGKDLDGKITSWNSAAQKMYGYSPEEILGKSISILQPKNLSDDLDEIMEKIKNGESIKNYDTVRVKKEGVLIDVSLYISPIFDSNGDVTGASTIAHDISERRKMEEELKESEEKYREVFNNANDMISLNLIKEDGLPGKFIDINKIGIERLGYSREEFLKMTPAELVVADKRSEMPKNACKLAENGYVEFEIVHQTKEGRRIPVEVNNHLFELKGNKVALAISRDITERKRTENALKNSEMKYRTIFENVQDVFFQTKMDGNVIEISPSIERYSGYKSSELIGKPVETFYLNPEDRKILLKKIEEMGEVVDYELKLKTKGKNVLYVSTNAHLLFDSSKNPIGIEGSLRDITDRKNIEIQLKNSLLEKEMLLKEIHHRVKNNLMIISSLLNLQSRYIKDKKSQEIFKESQNRAKSMALIHERLYQSTDLKRIDFGDYIRSLSSELFNTYVVDPTVIEFKINVEDIYLDINTAIPLGLIVNELITNSLKHAFPEGMQGEIDVDFHKAEDHYEFIVKDNGIGFPDTIDYKNTESLGMQMVNSLTEQIDGEIELKNGTGTTFKIAFKETKII
jgi:PAS domain S-box-containing protein